MALEAKRVTVEERNGRRVEGKKERMETVALHLKSQNRLLPPLLPPPLVCLYPLCVGRVSNACDS